MYPEHTALAYREAARQGADMIECDLAITRVPATIIIIVIINIITRVAATDTITMTMTTILQDHKFICAHEPYLSKSTDIASKPEFADRRYLAIPLHT